MISVIVPVYNTERYLEKCIQSILSQTFGDYEELLINDGSTDGSPQICDDFARSDSRIRVIHQDNMGVMNARKQGLCKAVGEYISFVDSDDWLEFDYLEKLYHAMTNSVSDIAVCNFTADYPQNRLIKKNKIEPGVYDMSFELWQQVFPNNTPFEFGLYPVYWNKLFKKKSLYEFVMRVPSNVSMGDDVAGVFPRAARQGGGIVWPRRLFAA